MSTTTDTGFHAFDNKGRHASAPVTLFSIVIFLLAILLGIVSGYVLSQNHHTTVSLSPNQSGTTTSGVKVGDVVGSNDTSAFKDTVEGELQEGGIDNEGQFHLVRPGGDSQNVYLTSSSVDLSQFVKHKVKVWGATQKAQKAGWLMDVGRVEVLQ